MTYRDPLAGLRSQVATKRGLVESRESAVPKLLRPLVPTELGWVFAPDLPPEGETFEELSELDAALDELVDAHARIADLVPKLRTCPDEVPDPPKPNLSPPWIIEETPQLAFRATFTRRLAAIDPEAWLVRWDDTTYLSRLQIAGAPVLLWSRMDVGPRSMGGTFHSAVRTSVPAALPALEIRCERLFDGIGRAIGAVRDLKTGDATFDQAFIVDGEETSVPLLGPDVRSALTELSVLSPRVHVRRGVAEIVWSGIDRASGAEMMPDAAIAVALGIRAAIERA